MTTYGTPEFINRVAELREKDKVSWKDIQFIVKDEFDCPLVSVPTLRTAYDKAMAITITVEKKAGMKFETHSKELEKMYGQTITILSKLVSSLESIYQEFETSDMDTMTKYLNFIKLSPQIKQTTEQILAYIKHHEEQQDKIRIEQKNMIYSTEQIKEKLDKYLKTLNEEGYVRILKKLP